MMVSTKGRYALRVMIDLAEYQTGDYIPLKSIAARQNISEKYLESIIKVLTRARLLNSLRGKGGGYKLARDPNLYTIGEILRLTEGSLAPVACLDCKPVDCDQASECRTLPMWQKLDTLINDYFDGITLGDLMRPQIPGNDFII